MSKRSRRSPEQPRLVNPYAAEEDSHLPSRSIPAAGAVLAGAAGLVVLGAGTASAQPDGTFGFTDDTDIIGSDMGGFVLANPYADTNRLSFDSTNTIQADTSLSAFGATSTLPSLDLTGQGQSTGQDGSTTTSTTSTTTDTATTATTGTTGTTADSTDSTATTATTATTSTDNTAGVAPAQHLNTLAPPASSVADTTATDATASAGTTTADEDASRTQAARRWWLNNRATAATSADAGTNDAGTDAQEADPDDDVEVSVADGVELTEFVADSTTLDTADAVEEAITTGQGIGVTGSVTDVVTGGTGGAPDIGTQEQTASTTSTTSTAAQEQTTATGVSAGSGTAESGGDDTTDPNASASGDNTAVDSAASASVDDTTDTTASTSGASASTADEAAPAASRRQALLRLAQRNAAAAGTAGDATGSETATETAGTETSAGADASGQTGTADGQSGSSTPLAGGGTTGTDPAGTTGTDETTTMQDDGGDDAGPAATGSGGGVLSADQVAAVVALDGLDEENYDQRVGTIDPLLAGGASTETDGGQAVAGVTSDGTGGQAGAEVTSDGAGGQTGVLVTGGGTPDASSGSSGSGGGVLSADQVAAVAALDGLDEENYDQRVGTIDPLLAGGASTETGAGQTSAGAIGGGGGTTAGDGTIGGGSAGSVGPGGGGGSESGPDQLPADVTPDLTGPEQTGGLAGGFADAGTSSTVDSSSASGDGDAGASGQTVAPVTTVAQQPGPSGTTGGDPQPRPTPISGSSAPPGSGDEQSATATSTSGPAVLNDDRSESAGSAQNPPSAGTPDSGILLATADSPQSDVGNTVTTGAAGYQAAFANAGTTAGDGGTAGGIQYGPAEGVGVTPYQPTGTESDLLDVLENGQVAVGSTALPAGTFEGGSGSVDDDFQQYFAVPGNGGGSGTSGGSAVVADDRGSVDADQGVTSTSTTPQGATPQGALASTNQPSGSGSQQPQPPVPPDPYDYPDPEAWYEAVAEYEAAVEEYRREYGNWAAGRQAPTGQPQTSQSQTSQSQTGQVANTPTRSGQPAQSPSPDFARAEALLEQAKTRKAGDPVPDLRGLTKEEFAWIANALSRIPRSEYQVTSDQVNVLTAEIGLNNAREQRRFNQAFAAGSAVGAAGLLFTGYNLYNSNVLFNTAETNSAERTTTLENRNQARSEAGIQTAQQNAQASESNNQARFEASTRTAQANAEAQRRNSEALFQAGQEASRQQFETSQRNSANQAATLQQNTIISNYQQYVDNVSNRVPTAAAAVRSTVPINGAQVLIFGGDRYLPPEEFADYVLTSFPRLAEPPAGVPGTRPLSRQDLIDLANDYYRRNPDVKPEAARPGAPSSLPGQALPSDLLPLPTPQPLPAPPALNTQPLPPPATPRTQQLPPPVQPNLQPVPQPSLRPPLPGMSAPSPQPQSTPQSSPPATSQAPQGPNSNTEQDQWQQPQSSRTGGITIRPDLQPRLDGTFGPNAVAGIPSDAPPTSAQPPTQGRYTPEPLGGLDQESVQLPDNTGSQQVDTGRLAMPTTQFPLRPDPQAPLGPEDEDAGSSSGQVATVGTAAPATASGIQVSPALTSSSSPGRDLPSTASIDPAQGEVVPSGGPTGPTYLPTAEELGNLVSPRPTGPVRGLNLSDAELDDAARTAAGLLEWQRFVFGQQGEPDGAGGPSVQDAARLLAQQQVLPDPPSQPNLLQQAAAQVQEFATEAPGAIAQSLGNQIAYTESMTDGTLRIVFADGDEGFYTRSGALVRQVKGSVPGSINPLLRPPSGQDVVDGAAAAAGAVWIFVNGAWQLITGPGQGAGFAN